MMLKGSLFENTTGVKMLGDISDLLTLHETVRKMMLVIADYQLQSTDASNLLLDFLEKIEKAYSGTDIYVQDILYRKQLNHYGFQSSWLELFMVSYLLRSLSDYAITDEPDEINMRLLEYIVRTTIPSATGRDSVDINTYIGKKCTFLSVKQFIAGFSTIIAETQTATDQTSFKKIKEYLNSSFEYCV